MRLSNEYGLQGNFDPGNIQAPWLWYSDQTLDGTAAPWKNAPRGSLFWLIGASTCTCYYRNAMNNATADWVTLYTASGGTITGDLTVTGTLTAGDVIVSA
mgnify:CR=1 FL=1